MYSPRSKKEREDQHKFFFWYKKENKDWIRNTLAKIGNSFLIDKLSPSNGDNNFRGKKGSKNKGGGSAKSFESVKPSININNEYRGKKNNSKKGDSKKEFTSVKPSRSSNSNSKNARRKRA